VSNYSLWGLFGPATWPWWLALLAFASLALSRSPRSLSIARASSGVAVAIFVGFAILPAGYWLIRPLETRFPRQLTVDAQAFEPDHIVVLAGAETLGPSAYRNQLEVNRAGERVIEGAALAHGIPGATLWIVGGVRRSPSPTADVEWTTAAWQRLGLAPERLRMVDRTPDTCANAKGVARLRPVGGILLVTSASHMPRAVACFTAAGLQVRPYPVDYSIWPAAGIADTFSTDLSTNMERTDAALHEWIGLIYYRLQGRTRELLPAR
jgi:uncharacterized SAM-binding protein YcdF (DUF218 family)